MPGMWGKVKGAREMKAILMSIQPKWCKLIAHGNKTIEVRKTKPNKGLRN